MGRSPCCAKEGMNRGAWTAIEDKILIDHISKHGEGRWRSIPKEAGLKRCGKSCRLRWLNYLRPDIKRGNITPDEDDLIIRLHKLLGNRWSLIAGRLPGRTDNEIKNYWNTTLVKKIQGRDQALNQENTKKRPNKAKQATQLEYTRKAVRTKAVRCNKVVIIAPPKQDRNDECGLENIFSPTTTTTTTTTTNSGEDFSALERLPIDFGGEDPDFWTMLNDWIMDEEDPNSHS